jgi:hypothetical protein
MNAKNNSTEQKESKPVNDKQTANIKTIKKADKGKEEHNKEEKKEVKEDRSIKIEEKKKTLKQTQPEDPVSFQMRQEQSKEFDNYIESSGLPLAFKLIFNELIAKQILPENYFSYTAMRLKQIGKDVEGLNMK